MRFELLLVLTKDLSDAPPGRRRPGLPAVVVPHILSFLERDEFEHFEALRAQRAASVKRCGYCGVSDVKLRRCTKCHRVRYCSREHQVAHWKAHKKGCTTTKGEKKKKKKKKKKKAPAASSS